MDRSQIVAEISGQLAEAKALARRRGLRALLNESVSLTHLHVLSVLRDEGPGTMGELAKALGVSLAGATGIVTRMEERGLVGRRRDEGDRRVVTVAIAPGGTATLEKIEGRGREHLSRLLAALATDELRHLQLGLAALRRAGRDLATEEGLPTGGTP